MMQRLITQQVVDQKGARYITDTLWMLMEHSIEEVKVLQTVTLLLTTNVIAIKMLSQPNVISIIFIKLLGSRSW